LVQLKTSRCHGNFATRIYQALHYGTFSFGTANSMRNILIFSVVNRKQDSCTLSDDYENKWDKKRWISNSRTLIVVRVYTMTSYGKMEV
jgi:hypothetical protein